MPDDLRPVDILCEDSKTLPGRYFTSMEIYRQEIEKIFYNSWLCLGRSARIQEPGAYFLDQIGEESVIVLRTPKGQVKAFYNVCRHRGTRMCTEPSGKFSNSIQCPYHAWTYNLEGALIGAPLMEDVAGFDKGYYPLHPVALVEWEGFLFANLAEEPQPFEQAFQPVLDKFGAWKLPELRSMRQIDYEVQANWKLIVQNYSECYHCPLIHPDLARKSPYRSGRNDLFEGRFLGGYMLLNHEYESLTMSGRACAVPLGNVDGEDLGRIYYYHLFPNVLLSLHPDYVMVHTLWPQAPDRTRIRCQWLFDPAQANQPDFNPDDAVDFWDMTNRQDWHVCELSQLGVSSRSYQPSPYSAQESLLAAFDRQVLTFLGQGNAEGELA